MTALARSWSISVIPSDHCITVPHLNDNTSLFIPFVQLNDVEGSLLVHFANKCFGFIMPNNHN